MKAAYSFNSEESCIYTHHPWPQFRRPFPYSHQFFRRSYARILMCKAPTVYILCCREIRGRNKIFATAPVDPVFLSC